MRDPQTDELTLQSVAKSFGATPALHPTDLTVAQTEFVTILGPSGCGKSTLLRIITGITPPTSGRVILRDHDITERPPERRDIAIVFQSYALFPHMSVADNIGFGLKMKRVPLPERRQRFDHVVAICGLETLLGRNPRALSGGQQQRVALARALVMQPAVLLLDEPLSNLDAKLRETLRDDLLALHRKTGSTSLYVTHDQTEAMSMSDRVVVMNHGRIVEIGTPRDLYLTPRRRFTATFLGNTNLITVEADGASARLPWGGDIRLNTPHRGTGEISLRPESLTLTADPGGPGVVTQTAFMGADIAYQVTCADRTIQVRHASASAVIAPGTAVALTCQTSAHLLEPDHAEASA